MPRHNLSAVALVALAALACSPRMLPITPVAIEPDAAIVDADGLSPVKVRLAMAREGYVAVLLASDAGSWTVLYPQMHQRMESLGPGQRELTFTRSMASAGSPTVGAYKEVANCFPDVAYVTTPQGSTYSRVVQTCRGRHLTGGPVLNPESYLIVVTSATPVKSLSEQRQIWFDRQGETRFFGWADPSEIARAAAPLLFGHDARTITSIYHLERSAATRRR